MALVPLERFSYPAVQPGAAPRRDGAAGRNRAPAAALQIDAANDLEAIACWLRLHPGGHTQRAYRKEAERFLLWALCQRGKAVADLNTEDAIAYRDFLAALDARAHLAWAGPLPREAWFGPKHVARGSPAWRPFAGPLSARSQHHAITVVNALCQWLTAVGYLVHNPFAALPPRLRTELRVQTGRALTAAQWRYVLDYLERMPAQGAAARRAHVQRSKC